MNVEPRDVQATGASPPAGGNEGVHHDEHEKLGPLPMICNHPVFIIGAPRSGTTVLAHSLARHLDFWTSEESQILWDVFRPIDKLVDQHYRRNEKGGGYSWLQERGIDKPEFLRLLGLGINALFTKLSQGKRWVDHTPIYTLIATEISQLFTGAFFIHILRDARRVIHSSLNYRNQFPKAQATWNTDFREAGRTWCEYMSAAMEFCSQNPARGLTIRNEDLVADAERGFERILSFIGAPQRDEPAHFFRNNRINSSFRGKGAPSKPGGQLEEPWRDWSSEQTELFLEECGPTIAKYGLEMCYEKC